MLLHQHNFEQPKFYTDFFRLRVLLQISRLNLYLSCGRLNRAFRSTRLAPAVFCTSVRGLSPAASARRQKYQPLLRRGATPIPAAALIICSIFTAASLRKYATFAPGFKNLQQWEEHSNTAKPKK